MRRTALTAAKFVIAASLFLATIISIQSCATTRKPKGCGCGMEERMGGRS